MNDKKEKTSNKAEDRINSHKVHLFLTKMGFSEQSSISVIILLTVSESPNIRLRLEKFKPLIELLLKRQISKEELRDIFLEFAKARLMFISKPINAYSEDKTVFEEQFISRDNKLRFRNLDYLSLLISSVNLHLTLENRRFRKFNIDDFLFMLNSQLKHTYSLNELQTILSMFINNNLIMKANDTGDYISLLPSDLSKNTEFKDTCISITNKIDHLEIYTPLKLRIVCFLANLSPHEEFRTSQLCKTFNSTKKEINHILYEMEKEGGFSKITNTDKWIIDELVVYQDKSTKELINTNSKIENKNVFSNKIINDEMIDLEWAILSDNVKIGERTLLLEKIFTERSIKVKITDIVYLYALLVSSSKKPDTVFELLNDYQIKEDEVIIPVVPIDLQIRKENSKEPRGLITDTLIELINDSKPFPIHKTEALILLKGKLSINITSENFDFLLSELPFIRSVNNMLSFYK